jgi:hypothetical protein
MIIVAKLKMEYNATIEIFGVGIFLKNPDNKKLENKITNP